MPTDRGFYWVLIRSLWRDSDPEWDLAHSDGRGHWLRCSTGMHLEPENVVEVGAKVEREETKPAGCRECAGTGIVVVRQGDPDDWGAPETWGPAICSLCHAENITVTSESLKEWHEHNKPEDRCPDCKGTGKVKALPELNAEGEQYDICALCHGGIRNWRTPLPELPGAAEAIEAALNDLQESENHLLDRLLNGPFRPK